MSIASLSKVHDPVSDPQPDGFNVGGDVEEYSFNEGEGGHVVRDHDVPMTAEELHHAGEDVCEETKVDVESENGSDGSDENEGDPMAKTELAHHEVYIGDRLGDSADSK